MRRNFLYIGLLLLAIGVVVGFFSSQAIVPSQLATPNVRQLQVNGSSLGYIPIYMNQSGLAIFYFNSTTPVDMYFANASAFGAISFVGEGGARSAAVGLEGKGVYEIYLNGTSGAFPYASSGFAVPTYIANITSAMQNGTYYAIFDAGRVPASITTKSVSVPLSAISSTVSSIALYGGATIVLVLAGLVLVVASFFLKGKPKAEEGMDEGAKKAYERLEKKRGR